MAKLEAKLEGDTLVVRIPTFKPTLSASGKTMLVAKTGAAAETDVTIDGKPLFIGLNAYTYIKNR